MREYPTNLTKMLSQGLRRFARSRRAEPALAECLNLKAMPWGLDGIEAPTNSITGAPEVNWPFPQLFVGREVVLLADKTAIYRVQWGTWELTQIETYDAADPETLADIPEGDAWHFMDFGTTWMLFNAACIVRTDNTEGMHGRENKALVQTLPRILTGVAHRGRGVFGGLEQSFWSEEWRTYLTDETQNFSAMLDKAMPMTPNMVLWSSIGGGDLTFWATLATAKAGPVENGAYDGATWNYLLETLMRNEWGFMPMPFTGQIYRLLPMGAALVVYGAHGVAALIPASEPAPTYGLSHLLAVGAGNRSAMAGDDRGHVMIDQAGYLWRIGPDLRPERLDYHEYLFPMIDAGGVVISHDPQEDEFWISNETDSYLLTANGLTRTNKSVTCAVPFEGSLVGFSTENENDSGALVVTDAIDMGLRDMKLVQTVEVASEGIDGLQVAVDWKNAGTTFSRSPYVTASHGGYAQPNTAGTDVRIVIKGDAPPATARVDGLIARWKLHSRNAARGAFAVPQGEP